MTEPVLRAATPEDDEGIARCIGEAFPGNPKARARRAAVAVPGQPVRPSPGWVWDDDGRIVAHYTAFPMPYLLDGAPARAGNAVDAAVVPSHQGRRLFTPLADALYADCAAAELPVALCYASNPVAMRGVARAGVHWMPRLRTVVLATDPAWLGRRFHVPPAAGELVRRAGFSLGRGAGGRGGRRRAGGRGGAVAADGRAGRHPQRDRPGRGVVALALRRLAARAVPRRSPCGARSGAWRRAAVVTVREDFGGRFGYLLELLADDADAAAAVLLRGRRLGHGPVGAGDDRRRRRAAAPAGHRRRHAHAAPPARAEGRAWFGFVDTDGRRTNLVDESWHVGWGDMDHL